MMEKVLQEAVSYLQKGKTILYPTDTIWGIGCDATSYQAVEKVFKIKRRKEHKSLIVLVDVFEKIHDYVERVPEIARDLVESMDTPLTIIFPKAKNLAKNVIGEDGSIAIRVTIDEFCRELVSGFGKPIVSTSANVSGDNHPLLFGNINKEIVDKVDYVVDFNKDKLMKTKASRIIKLEESGEFKVIRE
jgi:L-threonylcarbamoyladenylate synthase